MKSEIRREVHNSPGIHFRQLKREVGCSTSTLNHHVRRDEELKERKIRSYRRIYPSSVPEDLENVLAALNHSSRGKMLYLTSFDSFTPSEISRELGLSISTVSGHLKLLDREGLVSVEVKGRKKSYVAMPAVRSALKDYTTNIVERMSDNFIEMWG